MRPHFSMPRIGVPADVAAIRLALAAALNIKCDNGRKVGDSKYGVYAFYDFDGEPIYVGQTTEKLRVRIRRHLTNHRTDAVAMNVLDPFEVYDIEMWPFWDMQGLPSPKIAKRLDAAEYTVFEKLLAASTYTAVLNEKDMPKSATVKLPSSVRACIIPEELRESRKHPDVRIARRAGTIASLAKVISERDVSPGLRRTLHTQSRRLERLAAIRYAEFAGDPVETESEE
jgi:hypothetical protein